MDLSKELKRIQQEKHKKNNNNQTTSIVSQTTINQPSSSLVSQTTKQDTKPMDIDNDIKDTDNDIEMDEIKSNDDSNSNSNIDWDAEYAAQLEREYGYIEEQKNNESNGNGFGLNGERNNVNFGGRQSMIESLMNGGGMSDDDGISNVFQRLMEQRNVNGNGHGNDGGQNNGNGNGQSNHGSYSFSFQSSSNGPRGFSMVFSSNNNNNQNTNNTPTSQDIPNMANFGGLNNIFNAMRIGMPMGIPMQMNGINTDNMSYEELLNMFPVINHGLNDDEINNNSVVDKYKSTQKDPKKTIQNQDQKDSVKETNDDSAKCCICLDEFKNNDEIRRLPCLHIFHKSEIDKWLKTKDSCPICRQSISQNNN